MSEEDSSSSASVEPKKILSKLPDGTIMQFASKKERAAFYKKQAIPEPHSTHRELMQDIWTMNTDEDDKMNLIGDVVVQVVGPSEDPFQAILDLHRFACDYSVPKENRLAGRILDLFEEKWLNKRDDKEELLTKYLTQSTKERAFLVATDKHTCCLEKICRLFRLDVEDVNDDPELEELIRNQIKVMCRNVKFKEALDVVQYFGWQDRYDIEEFVIPCLLKGQSQQIEQYLESTPKQQLEYITFLDNLLPLSELQVKSLLAKYTESKTGNVKIPEMCVGKSLERFVSRLVNNFKLVSQVVAPNLARIRAKGHIRFQLLQRFDEQKITEQAYRDSLFGSVRNNHELQNYLAVQLCIKGLPSEAVWWCEFLNIPERNFPRDVDEFLAKNPSEVERIRRNAREYKLLNVEADVSKDLSLFADYKIIIVDNSQGLQELTKVLRTEKIVGIDAEWKPPYMTTKDEVALMQLACSEAVYLVDFFVLESVTPLLEWRLFLEALLTSEAVKLGFDLVNDLRSLFATLPSLIDIKSQCKNVVCLKMLVDNLLNQDESIVDIFDPTKDPEIVSGAERSFKLSLLYKSCVGKEMDKSQQTSDWCRRPLREAQVSYAALDAFCLIEIYQELCKRTQDREIDIRSLFPQSDPSVPKEKVKKEKKEKETDESTLARVIQTLNDTVRDNVEWKSVRDVKVIVDVMLSGLGKHLRRLGVDVLIPDRKPLVVDWARKSDRIVLSFGRSCLQLKQMRWLSQRVVHVPINTLRDPTEQTAYFFKHFNIKPSQNDIFSRCMVCNAMAFVLVPGPVLEYIYRLHVEMTSCYAREDMLDKKAWAKRLSDLPPSEFRGVGCRVEMYDEQSPLDMAVAYCEHGTIDVTNNLVLTPQTGYPVPIHVRNVPIDVLSRANNFFYVCGSCGKVYWDGGHIRHYGKVAEKIIQGSYTE